jgi:hypothetical protein
MLYDGRRRPLAVARVVSPFVIIGRAPLKNILDSTAGEENGERPRHRRRLRIAGGGKNREDMVVIV